MAEETKEDMVREREEGWARHIKSWEESGLTQVEYCRQNNLSRHKFTYWRCKRHRKNEPIKFVPLISRRAIRTPMINDSGLRLIIGDRYRIEVGERFSEEALFRLMAALESVM